MTKHAYLHCLYADDVRQESTGQLSLIGMFQGGLRVPEVPAQLPKLAIIANLFTPSNHKPAAVRLEVYLDGEVLETVQPPPEFMQVVQAAPDTELEEGHHMQFVVGFTGFQVRSAARLSVRAIVDGETIEGNALMIQVGGAGLLSSPSASLR